MDNSSVQPSAKGQTGTPSYVSKFRPNVLLEAKANKHARKTMGLPDEDLPNPHNYLKKNVGELRFIPKFEVERHIHPDKKPQIPPVTFKPSPTAPTTDFVKKAIDQEYTTVQPIPKCVVNQNGDRVVLQNLGCPIHVRKTNYGLMPQYLQKRIDKEKKALEVANVAERELREADEREKLEEQETALECLQEMWTSLNAEYCRLPLVIETRRVVNHKIYLEQRLAWLEKNIQHMENYRTKHPKRCT